MSLQIEWEMFEDRWVEAERLARLNLRGSKYDREHWPYLDALLEGRLDLIVGGVSAFPAFEQPGRPPVPFRADLAHSAADLVRIARELEESPAGSKLIWGPVSDADYMGFSRMGDMVLAYRPYEEAPVFRVPLSQFQQETTRFASAFTSALEKNAPSTLYWQAFAPLLPYASTELQAAVALWTPAPHLTHKEPRRDPQVHESGALRLEWIPREIDWERVYAAQSVNLPGSMFDLSIQAQLELFIAPLEWRIEGTPVVFEYPFLWSDDQRGYERWLDQVGYRWPRPEQPALWDFPWPLLGIALQAAHRLRPEEFAPPDETSWTFPEEELVTMPAHLIEAGVDPSDYAATIQEIRESWPDEMIKFGRTGWAVTVVRRRVIDELIDRAGEEHFDAVMNQFLHAFAETVAEYAPAAFDWECFSVLRRYANLA
jgi:hypothetical protein